MAPCLCGPPISPSIIHNTVLPEFFSEFCLFLKNYFLALFVLKQFKTDWAAPFIWESKADLMVKIQIVPKRMGWKPSSLTACSQRPSLEVDGLLRTLSACPRDTLTTHVLSHSTSVGRHCRHDHAVLFTWPYLRGLSLSVHADLMHIF